MFTCIYANINNITRAKYNFILIVIIIKEYAFININDFSKYKITNDKELENTLKILGINLN